MIQTSFQSFYEFYEPDGATVSRVDMSEKWSEEELLGYSFEYPAAAYRNSETHAGDDVAIFARGPGAFLFQSTHEQESKK